MKIQFKFIMYIFSTVKLFVPIHTFLLQLLQKHKCGWYCRLLYFTFD